MVSDWIWISPTPNSRWSLLRFSALCRRPTDILHTKTNPNKNKRKKNYMRITMTIIIYVPSGLRSHSVNNKFFEIINVFDDGCTVSSYLSGSIFILFFSSVCTWVLHSVIADTVLSHIYEIIMWSIAQMHLTLAGIYTEDQIYFNFEKYALRVFHKIIHNAWVHGCTNIYTLYMECTSYIRLTYEKKNWRDLFALFL